MTKRKPRAERVTRQVVRFWVWTDTGPVKLRLHRGQTLRSTFSYDNGEGWSHEDREWSYDGERVKSRWHIDASDCDGRHERWGFSTCAKDQLRAGTEDPDQPGIVYPDWQPGRLRNSQRDYAAEAMGY